jgi:uncharacterized SAM-binding protein YcdF (DUF218 family)
MFARPRRTVLIAVVVLLVALHPVYLGAIGDFLVASDELQRSDVIVVLAGNSPFRSRHGVELYNAGWAPRLLISNEPLSSHGVQTTWLELKKHGLVKLGVPDEAVFAIEQVSDSTFEEATSTREIMRANGWTSAIVVTDPFHMRRAVMIFRRAFRDDGLVALASPADGSKYGVERWWLDPFAIQRVAQEYVKFGYYAARGRL